MRKLSRLVALLVLASLALGACIRWEKPAGGGGRGEGFQDSTVAESYDFTVEQAYTRVLVRLNIEVSQGSYSWTLADPEGKVRWQGKLSAGQTLDEARDQDCVAGRWTLSTSRERATGSCDVSWTFWR